MKSSDSNVCIAKNGKLVFIGSGQVTITVYPEDNPELAKEYVISVEEDYVEPEINENPENNNANTNQTPEEPAKNGCSGSVVPTFVALVSLFGFVLYLTFKKKTSRG